MATANMHGDVALWDLSNRQLVHIMKGAHNGLVSSVSFLNNQPILVTAGSDNAVIVSALVSVNCNLLLIVTF